MNGGDSEVADVFEALADEQRRRLLVALMERNPRSAKPDPPDEAIVDDDQLRRLRLDLHHHHLPKLVDLGFVDWDQTTDEVTKGPRFDELRPHLEPLRDSGDGRN